MSQKKGLRAAMDAEAERRKVLEEFISTQMKEDVDFAKRDKGSSILLKSGAEKLVGLFGCVPQYQILRAVEQLEGNERLWHYVIRCRLLDETDKVVAEGLGAANSQESSSSGRAAPPECPACGAKGVLIRSQFHDEWVCWTREGGCGSKFALNHPGLEDATERPMIAVGNSVLKIAKKRAMVDGAISLARCSDLFTQDLEDVPATKPKAAPAPKPTPAEAKGKMRTKALAQELRQATGKANA